MKQWRGPVRILLDTNILISALLSTGGPPHRLVELWLDSQFELVSSREQINELRRATDYEHLRSRIHPMDKKALLENLATVAIIVDPVSNVEDSPDPDDNIILATAIAGKAALIVSGDKKGMLELDQVKGVPIVTATAALELLGDLDESER